MRMTVQAANRRTRRCPGFVRLSRRSRALLAAARTFLGLSLCLLRPAAGRAQAAPSFADDPRVDALMREGLPLSYNLRYRPAQKVWDELIRLHPDHPAGYVHQASLLWWQALEDRKNKDLEKQFKALIKTAVEKGRERLRQQPEDESVLAGLGRAYALAARFDATVTGGYLSAMRNGIRGYQYAQAAHRLAPAAADPLVEIGGYEYYAAALPAVIKPFAWLLGPRGNKTRGIQQLLRAAGESRYARTEAEIVLLSVYYSEERWQDYERALESLMKEYPLNHVFHMWAANSFIERKRWQAGAAALESAAAWIRPAEDEYAAEARAWLNFHLARIRFAARAWADSLQALQRAEEAGSKNPVLPAQLYLLMGNAFDALGNREAARAAYDKVLGLPDIEESRSRARRYLKTAYRPRAAPRG